MSITALTKKPLTSEHFYTDSRGTYRVDRLFEWVNSHPEKHKLLPVTHFLEYTIHDTWDNFDELRRTNFRLVFDDQEHQQRIMQVDLTHPIIVTNFNRLIDGVHRLFKAIFEKKENIKAVFIDQSQLDSIKLEPESFFKDSRVEGLPIEDIYLSLPPSSLPENKEERRNVIEDYFPDHLPTATSTDKGFEVCLERPSSPYGCYAHDEGLKTGLEWWQEKTRVRDICAQYRFLDRGILALEEQWVPLSWSRTFRSLGKIPDELVLLHLDDHQDMMAPRIGKRLDGEMVDYITGNHIDFLDPDSVKKAIESGAIGKGSILTPLIWLIPKIHVRHLSFRPHPNTTYKIDKTTFSDNVLFSSKNRIGLHFLDTSWENLNQQSSYVVTPNFDTWLHEIPEDIPVFLHFDLDYFNNRFDGNSLWREDSSARSFDPQFTKQKQHLKRVVEGIKQNNLQSRIIDTSIGISPGFFPAEFWEPMVNEIYNDLRTLGINLTKGASTREEVKEEIKVSIKARKVIARAEMPESSGSDSEKKVQKEKNKERSSSKIEEDLFIHSIKFLYPETDNKLDSPSILSPTDRKILIISQGHLSLYLEMLPEINLKNISIVTCKNEDSFSYKDCLPVINYVKNFFESGEVERVCFNLLKENNFDLIVATSETDILRAARLRDLFHIEGQSYKSALFFRDKVHMKTLLKKHGIAVPEFRRVTSALDILDFVSTHPYPLILKPSRGYGSIKTHILRNNEETRLLLDTDTIFNEFHQTDLDLEQFIEAEMYHVDGIVRDGAVLAMWPSKCINNCLQMTTGKPTGGYLLAADNPLTSALNQYTKNILEILPTPRDGGFHLELFYTGTNFIFCEIASRIGGPWINDLWVNGMGINLQNELIRAQALLPTLIKSGSILPSKLIGGIIFPPIEGKVISIADTCTLEGVIQYTHFITPGIFLEKPNGMLGHIASITIAANSEEEMEAKIKEAQEWFEINLKIDKVE